MEEFIEYEILQWTEEFIEYEMLQWTENELKI
jgi:hypothetical protein